jgi:hypothetical protein
LVSPRILLGVQAFNPIGAIQSPDEGVTPPGRILLGFAFRLTESFLISAELEKEFEFRPTLKTGMEYQLSRTVDCRIGYATLSPQEGVEGMPVSSSLSFGFGLKIGALNLDVAGSMHSNLGWTPAVSLTHALGKNQNKEGS